MARFRVSIFKQRGHVAMVLRQIPVKLLNFTDLGTPPVLKDLILRPRGLILVTGPTGSGKTTTLAAMVDYLNDNVDHHIITIEDPIEFYHTHKKATINQREIGVDVPSFAEAIRRALRQDPDVIMVGEMRDLETIEAAITAAETGHIVFATLHTTGAQGTVNRIIDVFPTNQQEQIRTQLSASVIGILSQALVAEDRRRADRGLRNARGDLRHRQPDPREQDVPHHLAIQTGQKQGMQLLDDHLFKLWRQGLVEKKEALFKANDADDLTARMAKAETRHLRRRRQKRLTLRSLRSDRQEKHDGDSADRPNSGGLGVPQRRATGDVAGGAAAAARRNDRADRHEHGPDHRRAVGPGVGRADGHAGGQSQPTW